MSRAHSGRRPELRDETPGDGSYEPRSRRQRPRGHGAGRTTCRREAMKSPAAKAPDTAPEGRCASCGEEILPVPT